MAYIEENWIFTNKCKSKFWGKGGIQIYTHPINLLDTPLKWEKKFVFQSPTSISLGHRKTDRRRSRVTIGKKFKRPEQIESQFCGEEFSEATWWESGPKMCRESLALSTPSLLLHGKLPQNLRVAYGTSILFPQSLWVEDTKRFVERNTVERDVAPSPCYQKWGCFQWQRVAGVRSFAKELMFVLLLKVSSRVAGEIDQWLETLAALAEDPDLCLSSHMVVHSYL